MVSSAIFENQVGCFEKLIEKWNRYEVSQYEQHQNTNKLGNKLYIQVIHTIALYGDKIALFFAKKVFCSVFRP